jgi:hypothetical protein
LRPFHQSGLGTRDEVYFVAQYSIEKMAYAVAEGARRAGATADVKRVPQNVPAHNAKAFSFHFKLDQPASISHGKRACELRRDSRRRADALFAGAGRHLQAQSEKGGTLVSARQNDRESDLKGTVGRANS